MAKAGKDSSAGPKSINGALIPLFDRLTDEEPTEDREYPVKRFYNRLELIQSIEREVARILNTRTTAKRAEYDELFETPVNFGLPEMYGLADFSQYDATNEGEWNRISEICEQAILCYEPRIKNVVVTVMAFDQRNQSLSLAIQADFALKEFKGEVTFPVAFTV